MKAATLSESAYTRLTCNELHYVSGLLLSGRECKSASRASLLCTVASGRVGLDHDGICYRPYPARVPPGFLPTK